MKKFVLHLFLLLSFSTAILAQPTFCLGYEVISSNSTSLVLELKLQGSSTFKLGSCNLAFNYNSTLLSNPTLSLTTSALTAPTPYNPINITVPTSSTVRFNALLNTPGTGATIAAAPAWTILGRITFNVLSTSQTPVFSNNAGLTVVFIDNESTRIFASSGCGVIPLDLLSFEAEKLDKSTFLKWSVVNAISMSAFEVQRSVDGKKFETIGEVKAINATDKKIYQFTDVQPTEGVNFYRLKMVEKDGQAKFSAIKTVTFSKDFAMKAYPNPVSDWVNVDFTSAMDNSEILVELLDLSGRVVLQQKGQVYNGSLQCLIDLRNLASGVYTLRAQDKGRVIQQKIVKQ